MIRTAAKSSLTIEILLLAAGSSSRMRGRDKLLENISGQPLLTRAAQACVASKARRTTVILRPQDSMRRQVLAGSDCGIIENPDWAEGMATSIRAGIARLPETTDAAIIALADMPDITFSDYNALIDAFDPKSTYEICRATTADGYPGHPVLFARSFFPALSGLVGDGGAKSILRDNSDVTRLVRLAGQVALTDLDTPKDWAAYHQS